MTVHTQNRIPTGNYNVTQTEQMFIIVFLSSELSYMCLANLERSLAFGGRCNIPSHAETGAILAS